MVMETGATVIIIISLALTLVIVFYIALVLRFVLRKAQDKASPDGPKMSFIDHLSGWHPLTFKVADTKCIPVQPRTYDDLKRVI